MIVGCAVGILKFALAILWWLLAPKLLKKARRRAKTTAHRARTRAPKQAKKLQRAARRSIVPN